MQKKKMVFIIALICAVVQGAKADDGWSVWDGSSMEQPEVTTIGDRKVILLKSAANLAYIRRYWTYRIDGLNTSVKDDWCYCQDYKLQTNIDMTAKSWNTFVSQIFDQGYSNTFDGDGHTIKIKIDDGRSENSQGLFDGLFENGVIKNLHMDVYIKVGNARKVGGIVGDNFGTIENCWVSGHVESDHYHSSLDADLGGIAGLNESSGKIKNCCVTADVKNTDGNSGVGGIVGSNEGTIEHVTFYGSVSVDHSQYNKWVGDQDGTLNNNYDSFNQSEYNSATGNDVYRQAIKYTNSITVNTSGCGTLHISAYGEDNVPSCSPGQTVTVTKTSGNEILSFSVKDADGNSIAISGDIVQNGVATFTMPNKSVTVTASFRLTWPRQGDGTEDNPYIISDATDWYGFATQVSNGVSYSGKFVKLTNNISVNKMCGYVLGGTPTKAFSGIFDGAGNTITVSISDRNNGAAPFSYINGATIKNLTIDGSIYGGPYTGGLVGFANGTNRIEDCTVKAEIRLDFDNVGGIVAHGMNSNTTISNCTFAGTVIGWNTHNVGGIWGWSDQGTPVIENCMEKGTYNNQVISMHPIGLQGSTGTVTNCYYLNPQKDWPTNASTHSGAYQVSYTQPDDEITKQVQLNDGNYYVFSTVSGVEGLYDYTGSNINVVPAVAFRGTTLTEGTDYTYTISPATVRDKGDYTLTITAKDGSGYHGTKTLHFTVSGYTPVTSDMTTLTTDEYIVGSDMNFSTRITISGNVVLHLAEGKTLTATKGIELSQGNSLTIYGPGTLTINGCDDKKSGIGAEEAGTLTINGGTINVTGGYWAAGIGGDKNNTAGGTITINGGVVNATGGRYGAGIGGGIDFKIGHYGICGDIIINGGQVTATGGDYATGIGPGHEDNCEYEENTYYNSGTLTLNWTKTDGFINCSGYINSKNSTLESITFANGKKYILEGTNTIATDSNIKGDIKKIVPAAVFFDKGDNSAMLSDCEGKGLPALLADRTLYKDGKWNTLCLPFNLVLEGSPLEGATARPLSSASISGTTLNLEFGDAVTTLEAGTPYIIKWAKADGYDQASEDARDIKNPVFNGVTIDATDRSYDNGVWGEERVRFLGTYKSTTFTAEDKSILFLGDANTLYYAGSGAGLGAQRAYFKIGSDGALLASRLTSFNIDFGDDEATGIISLTPDPSPKGEGSEYWYSLDGRRLDTKPTKKGVYINNGRRIVIK